MAIYACSWTLEDERGGQYVLYREGDFLDDATAQTAVTAMQNAIVALTGLGVVKRVGPSPVVTGISTPQAGFFVTNRASATMQLVTPGKKANLQFPAAIGGVFSGNNLVFNQSPLNEWDAFAIQHDATNGWFISDGEHVVATDPTIKGKLITVRSGQRTLPT